MQVNMHIPQFVVVLTSILCLACAAPAPSCSVSPSKQNRFWYEDIVHNGISPFIDKDGEWKVFRHVVKDYGADPSGVADSSQAFQRALDDGGRAANKGRITGKPAVVFVPQGSYLLNKPLQMRVETVLMGDPLDTPTLRAGPDIVGDHLIQGKDPSRRLSPSTNFYIAIKNLRLESTMLDPARKFTLLMWSVSQATQLTNLAFHMPGGSTGHTGVAIKAGSGTLIGDLSFTGGAIGINMSNLQYEVKSTAFDGCTTGILVSRCYNCVFSNVSFRGAKHGINIRPGPQSVILLDSEADDTDIVLNIQGGLDRGASVVIENLRLGKVTSGVVIKNGKILLSEAVPETWVLGSLASANGQRRNGTNTLKASRPAPLLSNGKYVALPHPTYEEHSAQAFINVKLVSKFPVKGDGRSDDTASLNAIIATYADCKIFFFPHGTYLVTDTIHFPPGTRVVGEAWSAISAAGSRFSDATKPKPMVQIGKPGDKGVAQFSDMLFTVAEALPGCTLVEVNMAGENPGDVGFWNTHIRIEGTAGSNVRAQCNYSPAECKAAFLLVHLTLSSSAYIENMWAWTADHYIDSLQQRVQTVSTGRGMLIEATGGTWMHGTAVEHNTLYQYNFHQAQNVFAAMQQSEAPYWQGPGSTSLAPAPWQPNYVYSDPDFSNCGQYDAKCRMAWYNYFNGGSDLRIYGSAFWTFFNGGRTGRCKYCQTNGNLVSGDVNGLRWYNVNTRGSENVVLGQRTRQAIPAMGKPESWSVDISAYVE